MDLLDEYGSSSDEDDQTGTTRNIAVGKAKATGSERVPDSVPVGNDALHLTSTSLKVNQRMKKDIWSKNFQKIKEFYDEKKHLTLPSTDPNYVRLSQWLTKQRYRPDSLLRKDQLERLESISYKTAKFHRDGDDDAWEVRYNQLKLIYDETGGVIIRSNEPALSAWVSRQKRSLMNNMLDPTRQARLGKLGIHLSTTNYRCRKKKISSKLEEKWQSQFEKLQEYYRIKGNCNVPRGWKDDRSLGLWVHNQRMHYTKMKNRMAVMEPDRIQKLEQLGFKWASLMSDRKSERK
jgi:hypothetical protein